MWCVKRGVQKAYTCVVMIVESGKTLSLCLFASSTYLLNRCATSSAVNIPGTSGGEPDCASGLSDSLVRAISKSGEVFLDTFLVLGRLRSPLTACNSCRKLMVARGRALSVGDEFVCTDRQ